MRHEGVKLEPRRTGSPLRRVGIWRCFWMAVLCGAGAVGWAEEPTVSYIFPAGGQRGTRVEFRVGGHYLHGQASFEVVGKGIRFSPVVQETNTVWFEGPVIPLPASQQVEDYPRDHAGELTIESDASLGARFWRVWTSQGATAARKFVVGDLPEVVEEEIDGAPVPSEVTIPVTINGRIFPREDVDIWAFRAGANEEILCEVEARSLGSPLEARLEAIGPDGRRVAESVESFARDPRLRFRAEAAGVYQVRIHDLNFGGLQHYVYRLSVSAGPALEYTFPLGGRRGSRLDLELGGEGLMTRKASVTLPKEGAVHEVIMRVGQRERRVVLDLDEWPEFAEKPGGPNEFSAPAVLNGMLSTPGELDDWRFSARKGDVYRFQVRAARLGSELNSVLTIFDAAGKKLEHNDDASGEQMDSELSFKAPADGVYVARVQDRFRSRGGRGFGYRLRVTGEGRPDFAIKLASDTVTVFREVPGADKRHPHQRKLGVQVVREGGFAGEIELEAEGLPEGVTISGNKISVNQQQAEVVFRALPGAPIGGKQVRIIGAAKVDGVEGGVVRRAGSFQSGWGDPAMEGVFLAVGMPTPFRVQADYLLSYAPRGSVYARTYRVDRGNFQGPLTVKLAERQVRHLQGVAGAPVALAPGQTSFEYPVILPTRLEIGRTSRSAVMAEGEVEDLDGRKHRVSYSSGEQADQIIAVIAPGLLNVEPDRRSIMVEPGATVEVGARVQRDTALRGADIRLELIVPKHFKGIRAEPVLVRGDSSEARLAVEFLEPKGPFNMPLVIRATTLDPDFPHVAEANVELVTGDSRRIARGEGF